MSGMSDMRSALLNGNKTSSGGVLIGTGETMMHHGTRVAVQGDFATCPACKVGGPVFNNCEPSFVVMEKSILVEGARVHCRCHNKPYVIPSQNSFTIAVNRGGRFTDPADAFGAITPDMSNKLVADPLERMFTEDKTRICPNMTNEAFASMAMHLCAELVKRTEIRLSELRRWNAQDQRNVATWFGLANDNVRQVLVKGLGRMKTVFETLTPSNFVRYSETALEYVGCVAKPGAERRQLLAAVCKPDVRTHTIAVALRFCEIQNDDDRQDSKLLTIAHEVSHFQDTMDTTDDYYSLWNAIAYARKKSHLCIKNADNVAGYIVVHGAIPDAFGAFARDK